MSKNKKQGASGPFAALGELKKKLEDEERKKAEEKAKPKASGATRGAGAAPAARPNPAPKSSAADEALSFHRLMAGVVPLDHTRVRVPVSEEAPSRLRDAAGAARRESAKSAAAAEQDAVHEHLRSLAFGGARFEIADDGRRVEGRRVEVPPDVLRKLRRGLFPIDARLDLHGLRTGEARPALEAFLGAKRAAGERCVLVVHGKGEHSPGGVGVLRGEVAAWLSQGRASEHVGAFATADDADGGEGAIYVLLRR